MRVPADVQETFRQFLAGYIRKVAHLKLSGDMPLKEGKAAVSIAVYRLICNKTICMQHDFGLSLFAWAFTTLAWNLMARCISNASLMLNHLGWGGDCLEVTFAKHKGDPEGRSDEPKHVFANPYSPEICPITSLGLFVFTMGPREDLGDGASGALFGKAESVEKRYSEFLLVLSKQIQDDLALHGLQSADIGSHSFRKGLVTHLCGLFGGPNSVAIYIQHIVAAARNRKMTLSM